MGGGADREALLSPIAVGTFAALAPASLVLRTAVPAGCQSSPRWHVLFQEWFKDLETPPAAGGMTIASGIR